MRRLAAAAVFVLVLPAVTSIAEEPAPPASPSSQAVALDPAVLREVLRTIDAGGDAEESLDSLLWRWLGERLADLGIGEALLRVPSSAVEWFSRLAIAAMIGVAVWIAVNELRQRHGGFRRRRRRGGPAAAKSLGLDWAKVAALPAAARPGAALKLALTALADQGAGWLSATHREVFVHARRTRSAPWRRPLARLAVLAERSCYGAWRPTGEEGDAAVALGQAVAQAAEAP